MGGGGREGGTTSSAGPGELVWAGDPRHTGQAGGWGKNGRQKLAGPLAKGRIRGAAKCGDMGGKQK